jgi:hypothetical protein
MSLKLKTRCMCKCGCDSVCCNIILCVCACVYVYVWWPRTVHVLPELAHPKRARRKNNIELPDCTQFGTVRGHHINTPDDIETDAFTSTFPHVPDFQLQ